MKNIIWTILILTLVSCNQRNPIEKTLLAKPGECWTYYTSNWEGYTYYKFKDNNLSYRYAKDNDYKFSEYSTGGVMDERPEKWSVSKDSIMTWRNFSFDVVSYNDKAIVLLSFSKEKPYSNYIFLIKEYENNPTKWGFDQKRIYNPEKYHLQK